MKTKTVVLKLRNTNPHTVVEICAAYIGKFEVNGVKNVKRWVCELCHEDFPGSYEESLAKHLREHHGLSFITINKNNGRAFGSIAP